MKWNSLFLLMFSVVSATAQFAPEAGKEGSTAVPFDADHIIGWGTSVTVQRGPQDIAQPISPPVTHGTENDALGVSDGLVISLGDGGTATYLFDEPLVPVPGYDFAVFENGFDNFLELAFVEVSENGTDFVRFPSITLMDTTHQIDAFGATLPERIHNFAGKYTASFGFPFDLDEIKDQIDINNIRFIRIVDVVGSINELHCTRDATGTKVNDPYPTDFETGGFDLDAIAILTEKDTTISSVHQLNDLVFRCYPNPAKRQFKIDVTKHGILTIIDLAGNTVHEKNIDSDHEVINIEHLQGGHYYVQFNDSKKIARRSIVILD